MKAFLAECRVLFSYPQNIILLLTRMVLAFGFVQPALMKINDLEGTAKWFESMHVPLANLFAYMVSGFEAMGIVLLFLGLFTRFISIFLSFVMLTAIYLVHLPNGFSVANNGVEIPLYYLIFLLLFATFGAGKYSLDHLLFEGEKYE